jgi:hypothetical protein
MESEYDGTNSCFKLKQGPDQEPIKVSDKDFKAFSPQWYQDIEENRRDNQALLWFDSYL